MSASNFVVLVSRLGCLSISYNAGGFIGWYEEIYFTDLPKLITALQKFEESAKKQVKADKLKSLAEQSKVIQKQIVELNARLNDKAREYQKVLDEK